MHGRPQVGARRRIVALAVAMLRLPAAFAKIDRLVATPKAGNPAATTPFRIVG
jgi:hypothetical protein